MRDIARHLDISLGLCYRYYDSKQKLFQEAMQQYVERYVCCLSGHTP
ncbi:MAG: TetR/AcrR family transcriptional regulator [[Clostridium] innocuum]